MTKDPLIYLNHIQACISKIFTYTKGLTEDDFLERPIIQDAVIRNFEIIGEATKQLDAQFRARYPVIEWKKIAGMRDKLIHDYIEVDLWAVWGVVEEVIPKFDRQIKEIMKIEKERT